MLGRSLGMNLLGELPRSSGLAQDACHRPVQCVHDWHDCLNEHLLPTGAVAEHRLLYPRLCARVYQCREGQRLCKQADVCISELRLRLILHAACWPQGKLLLSLSCHEDCWPFVMTHALQPLAYCHWVVLCMLGRLCKTFIFGCSAVALVI